METHYSEKFNEYLKKKNFKEKNGRIKIGRTTINKEDLIYDISHMAEKPTSFNLRSDVHEKVLEELKKTGMPANLIRNRKLCDIYFIRNSIKIIFNDTFIKSKRKFFFFIGFKNMIKFIFSHFIRIFYIDYLIFIFYTSTNR